jgi:hypothetical protein
MGVFGRMADSREKRRVEYHFSPRAGNERWDKFVRSAQSQGFIDALSKHPGADAKLVQHAQSLHDLAKAEPLGKVQSSTSPSKTYEIRKTPDGRLACTCNDWRFKSSVDPGHECKHIAGFRQNKVKVGAKMPNFADMTSSFFDELSDIRDKALQAREEEIDKRTERPFSSLLTQDEEPTEEPNPAAYEMEEPEVVVRSGA